VSTFFTLSGFLITALMVAEHGRSGTVSLRCFWERRLRRLMPAALTVISLITVASIWLADTNQWLRLRPDALASTFYVANWRFILTGDAYGALFQSPSPFTHFWSLAIEEQFYLVLPLVVVVSLVVTRGSRRILAGLFATLSIASIAWANWLAASGASPDRLYFGTGVRLPELLVGSLLALWWMRREEPLGRRGSMVAAWVGPIALVVVVLCWRTVDLDTPLLYRGGLTAYALLTVIVVISAMVAVGPMHRVLAWRPLVWVGVLSYAVYLFHYPILVWLRQHSDLGGWTRLGVGLVLTFGASVVSGRLIEMPVREGRRFPERRVFVAAAVGLALTSVLVLAVTSVFNREVSAGDTTTFDRNEAWDRFLEQTAAQAESAAPQIRFYGDSTALLTAMGMSTLSRERPDEFVSEGGFVELGCGLLTGTERRRTDEIEEVPPECDDWLADWAAAGEADPGDVAVIQLGPWEVADQKLTPDGEFLSVDTSEELRAALVQRLGEGVDVLAEHHAAVVILAPPQVSFGRLDGRDPGEPYAASDPARMEAFHQVINEVAASRDHAEVVDLGAWVQSQPDDNTLRPDGVHFSDDAALRSAEWLAPQVLEVYSRLTGRTDSGLPG
jgi:peptidoglycan/LPS O-acetylase OafA/YrhL/lysophospholipase L1-like esterase